VRDDVGVALSVACLCQDLGTMTRRDHHFWQDSSSILHLSLHPAIAYRRTAISCVLDSPWTSGFFRCWSTPAGAVMCVGTAWNVSKLQRYTGVPLSQPPKFEWKLTSLLGATQSWQHSAAGKEGTAGCGTSLETCDARCHSYARYNPTLAQYVWRRIP